MKFFKVIFVTILLMSFSQSKAGEKIEQLKNKILKNIRCLVCQGQSVYDSETDFALSIKLVVDRKINDGESEQQVYEFLREKYGDWIIYNPKLDKNTYILWLLPLLLFLLGGAIIYRNLIIKKN